MFYYTAGAMLIVAFLSGLFVWRVVDMPINALEQGTKTSFAGAILATRSKCNPRTKWATWLGPSTA